MNSEYDLKVELLGGFKLMNGESEIISDQYDSGKIYHLLVFLLTNRNERIAVKSIADALWEEKNDINYNDSIKSLIYRLRKLLNKYIKNKNCILSAPGVYYWNPDVKVYMDIYDFESKYRMSRDISKDLSERIEMYKQAVKIYKGLFLYGVSDEFWVEIIRQHYQSIYLSVFQELSLIYQERKCVNEEYILIQHGLKIDPYEEIINQSYIDYLIRTGNIIQAHRQYEFFKDSQKKHFGIIPEKNKKLETKITRKIGIKNVFFNQFTLHELISEFDVQLSETNIIHVSNSEFLWLYRHARRNASTYQEKSQITLYTCYCELDDSNRKYAMINEMMNFLADLIEKYYKTDTVVCKINVNQYVALLFSENNIFEYEVNRCIESDFFIRYNQPYTYIEIDNEKI